ncbi:transglutaminase family protein [Luteolibacter flavescens]|uniref:Transglutaminase family protein n=1 Tax=Luteolibacter flavescens TaxID=1859460 RepID=A0ABT3FV21_9BACT|nr:transglutaminase family protein [Luteolibacter flavescens]MCW1887144.1 transglutaminase family protein [Luteolibacter flavescens]
MPFQIHAELHYQVLQRSTVLLNLHALKTPNQTLSNEVFEITPGVKWEELPIETSGDNRYIRLDTGDATQLDIAYSVTADIRPQMVSHQSLRDVPVSRIHRSALPFLFPSRYCQADLLGKLAWKEFGGIAHPYDQVVAIADWIFENIDYLSGSTDTATSAFDTVTQRAGVCRDFAHLGIALCRALSIPARYFTGYACDMQPPDFHACFEACIGNRWIIFDPTRLASLNGLVRIATGRDAADASVATIFGSLQFNGMVVSCTSPDFKPLGPDDLAGQAIVIDS